MTAVSVFSLVAAFAGFLGWEVLRYRSQVVERLDRTQWILVERITAKLAEDPETHEFPLDGLAQDETILAAAVYSLDNQVLDSYLKPGTDEVVPPPFRTNVDPNAATSFKYLVHNFERIGIIYLKADTSGLAQERFVVPLLEELHNAGTETLGRLNDELAPWKVQSGQVSLPALKTLMGPPLQAIDEVCSRCGQIAVDHGSKAVVDDLGKIVEASANLRRGLSVTIQDDPDPAENEAEGVAVEETAPPPLAPLVETGKLLVVDDDHLNREMIRRRLRHMGFEIVLASDGLEALAALE